MLARHVGALLLALSLAVPACSGSEEEEPQYAPRGTPVELGLAGYAKVVCSAVFVSGRDPEEAARHSGYFFLAEADRDKVTDSDIDRQEKTVRMTWGGSITRTAQYYGDQGCVIHPPGAEGVFFEPVAVETTLPDAMSQPWPMGDLLADAPLPPEIDKAELDAAVETAFADPEALTAAFLVVYKGRIIAERYGPGIDKDTQLESWSMGKSLTATLVGLLVGDGEFGLYDSAPVPAWQGADDPRSKIRIADLLHMSSGLRFIAPRDPDYTPEKGYPDHMYVYTGAIDVFDFSIDRPLQFPPNTEGRYRNSDPLTLGYIIRETVRRRGEEYLTYPQRALFDRIGIRKQVMETDPYGNFLLTGYDYGTARNWARLGMLYLQDGVWEGKRVLPEGWVEFVSTPAPAWSEPVYGGLFWLNRTGEWNLPLDAYFMAGGGGQRTFIVPSHHLVIVRMGHFRGDAAGMRALNIALGQLIGAIRADS
ncbi:MAG: serine hydrolase domain-containing protein [Acidobacteriota bacterium]